MDTPPDVPPPADDPDAPAAHADSSPPRPLVVLALLALLVRVPAYLSSAHLTFDDGVFGASAAAMRAGGAPFRDVFSSQGPLFLPLVWMGDLVGLRTAGAPRVAAVVSGIAVTLLVFVIARRLAGPAAGALAAAATGFSGSVLWTTGPLAADGVGLALALGAVAVALNHRDDPSLRGAVAIGALIGAAFAVKSLFAVPPAVVIAWVLLEQRDGRRLAAALAGSAVVVLAVSAPWGFAAVWDQAVDYHLDAAGSRTPGANASKVLSTLWDRDLLALAVGAGGAAALVARRARRVPTDAVRRRALLPVVAWLAAILAVLVLEHPLWRPHLAHLVAPLAITGAVLLRDHLRAVLPLFILVLAGHLATNTDILWPDGYSAAEQRARDALAEIPPDAHAISDEPGLVWRAGRRTPDDLVDTSILRVESGRMTAGSVTQAAAHPRVCAVLVWSHRFGGFELGPRLEPLGYALVDEYGNERVLYRRPCR